MPVRNGAVTFARFRSERSSMPRSETKRWLLRSLKRKAFEPLEPGQGEEDRAAGFVDLESQDGEGFDALLQGEYALFAWRVDAIKVPAAAVKQELEKWELEFAAEKGRPPVRHERNERREAIRQALRQRTAPVTRVHDVSWNLEQEQLQIWAASRKAVEEIALAIEEAFEVKLAPLTPGALAQKGGVAVERLLPTRALIGIDVAKGEVDRVEA